MAGTEFYLRKRENQFNRQEKSLLTDLPLSESWDIHNVDTFFSGHIYCIGFNLFCDKVTLISCQQSSLVSEEGFWIEEKESLEIWHLITSMAQHVSGEQISGQASYEPSTSRSFKVDIESSWGERSQPDWWGWSSWPRQGMGVEGCVPFILRKFDSIPSLFIKHLLYSKHWIQISKMASSFL